MQALTAPKPSDCGHFPAMDVMVPNVFCNNVKLINDQQRRVMTMQRTRLGRHGVKVASFSGKYK